MTIAGQVKKTMDYGTEGGLAEAAPSSADLSEHVQRQLAEFRRNLLDLTPRNPLLAFDHKPRAQTHIRIIDEVPDLVFEGFGEQREFTILALQEPRTEPDDESTAEFLAALTRFKEEDPVYRDEYRALEQRNAGSGELAQLERKARDRVRFNLGMEPWEPEVGLSSEQLAIRRGIDPNFDLSQTADDAHEQHLDDGLQTLLFQDVLQAKLRALRERARSSVREMGIPTLYAAFGFLEWHEDRESTVARHAPLLLMPLEMNRRLVRGAYRYSVSATDVSASINTTLAVFLRERHALEIPAVEADDTPETYFRKIEEVITTEPNWRIQRFLTIGVFPFAKIALYEDLDPYNWPSPEDLVEHESISRLVASTGDVTHPFAPDYEIDEAPSDGSLPPVIYDADSSQHSAVVDICSGTSLAIQGPPGTGKSQTITNAIAAALGAGKTVLFVAEKLAALEVVHDRLRKAGLGEFCLELHGRRTRKSDLLAGIRERFELEPPAFDQDDFEDSRRRWKRQRDALKRYAKTMNERPGRQNLTVHEILWRTIRDTDCPPNVEVPLTQLRLPDVEMLSGSDVGEVRDRLDQLQRCAADASGKSVLAEHPWRGMEKVQLSPPERTDVLRFAAEWAEALRRVQEAAARFDDRGLEVDGLAALARLRDKIGALPAGSPPSELAIAPDPFRVAGRPAFLDAINTKRDLDQTSADLSREYPQLARADVDPVQLEEWVRTLDAQSEGASLQDLLNQEQDLLRDAERLDAVIHLAEGIADALGVSPDGEGALPLLLTAAQVASEVPRRVLLLRSPGLVDERERPRLDVAVRRLREVRDWHEKLSRDFRLAGAPPPRALRQAADTLRNSGLFGFASARVGRAKKLHRDVRKESGAKSRDEMASELEMVAECCEQVNHLANDDGLRQAFGSCFDGLETDLDLAVAVADWASFVTRKFPGTEPRRQAIRECLLTGDLVILDEIRRAFDEAKGAIGEAITSAGSLEQMNHDCASLRERARHLRDSVSCLQATGFTNDTCIRDIRAGIEALHRVRVTETRAAMATSAFAAVLPPCLSPADLLASERACLWAETLRAHDVSDAVVDLIGAVDEAELRHWTSTLDEALRIEKQHWAELQSAALLDETSFLDGAFRSDCPIETLARRARACATDEQGLSDWCAYRRARTAAMATSAAPLVSAFEAAGEPFDELVHAYDFVLHRSLAARVYDDNPDLHDVSGDQLSNAREEFTRLDHALLGNERQRLRSLLSRREIDRGVSWGRPRDYTEAALLHHELSLKRSTLPARNLMARSSKALRQLKPCFMMSPVTVAQLLPRVKDMFDIVLIDEASQMRPEDAFGALARAKQCVIVGDPKQLPPTSFFERSTYSDEAEEEAPEELLSRQVEAILDLALKGLRPARELRWHYRSHHSGLIRFSNHHFYGGRLTVFPAPDEHRATTGVDLVQVPGRYAGGANEIEAEATVEAALAFMKGARSRNHSLGIVAINQRQRDILAEKFDLAFREDPDAERYRRKWEETLTPFFVKNLENVQGDERDAIFISLVYGPDSETGVVANRFGPITWPGGDRRLNVLFTRARQQVKLFSSMSASDIRLGETSSDGVRALRAYLEYAATGRVGTGEQSPVPDTESPFEQHVMRLLQAHGYEVTPQWGVAGYRIDLAVGHPFYPHGFILGVECDGATYHSGKSVRDRDRLRQEILEGLGWTIHRIWSTDWFQKSSKEMERLVRRLEEIRRTHEIAPDAARPHHGEPQDPTGSPSWGAAHELRSKAPEHVASATSPETSADDTIPFSAEDITVAIGDSVRYRLLSSGEERCVTIVDGPDDPDRGVVNDGKPLAIALLGCAVGDVAVVEQPTTTSEIEVLDVEKGIGLRRRDDEMGPASGDELAPYIEWDAAERAARSPFPDPRTAPRDPVAAALLEIIEQEGPVIVSRAYRMYVRTCGIQRVGHQIRNQLNRALRHLEASDKVVLEDETKMPDYTDRVVRRKGEVPVRLRARGKRHFHEIPLSELQQHVLSTKNQMANPSDNELFREVLNRLEILRMTVQIKDTLRRAVEYSGPAR